MRFVHERGSGFVAPRERSALARFWRNRLPGTSETLPSDFAGKQVVRSDSRNTGAVPQYSDSQTPAWDWCRQSLVLGFNIIGILGIVGVVLVPDYVREYIRALSRSTGVNQHPVS